jgi:hypothetical protein
MSQYAFGAGKFWAMSQISATPTPNQFGALQEASVDFTSNIKELFGSYQLPLAVGRGTMKVEGKATAAQFQGRILSDLFFGTGDKTVGQILVADSEPQTIPAATPYTVTVNNAGVSGAGFGLDMGVRYASSNIPFVRIASGVPTVGQYTESAGTYTFAAADEGVAVQISYTYTPTTNTAGETVTLTNTLIGSTPSFTSVLSQLFQGERATVTLFNCTASKYTFATKLEDFNIPELDFSAYCNNAQQLGTISLAELS